MERNSEYGAKEEKTHVDLRGGIDFSKSCGACMKKNINGI